MTAGWGIRAVRAAVFAAVCVVLAALGHVMMSGSSVPWWTMAAGGAVTGGAGWCLAGRERGLPLIVTVVVVAQGLLHTGFSLAQSAAPPVARGSMGSAGRDMDSAHMGAAAMDSVHMGSVHTGSTDAMDMGHMGSGPMAHPAHDMDGMSSLGMLAAHLLAALLCGLWLAYGERAAFRILRAVAGRLAAPLRLLLHAMPAPPHRPRVRVPRRSPDRSPRRLLLVHAITSRGPPVGTAVA
ncbi:hypothetical protein OOK29_20885 [Streptomyces phaeochromogenes]|uniref:Integral-membrane protein n=1 Tax=Streptomyces phaeochromogenes TaxID=1923 RepID=A0ABZ1H8J8_STRPH|nr:hypothetical protein [Streptomyces phaeochromogenes]MCX5600606.1 hypothetical protein [Streptomyces phaeochromogenes]WSD13922.1 hypothetical protein OHB35_12110 [Streptomyces phaeochromogenes]